MARKVLVRLVDDLDGSPSADVAPVTFALDGVTYQIDLNQRNASKLRDSLAAFVASARRTSGRAKRGTAIRTGSGTGTNDVSAIREWAKEQGFPVSARGRIPANILAAYNSADGAETTATPKRAPRAKTAAAAKPAPTATAPARRGRPAGKPAAAKSAPKTTKSAPARAAKPAAAAKSTAGKASATRATGRTTRAAATTAAKSTAAKSTTAKAAPTKASTAKASTAKASKPAAAKTTRAAKASTPAPRRAVARKAKG
ncbi:MAG TPA: Lsr2 family protein [Pseudonocardiaceae bacterium]|jgi:hypothetical protein|nr:Lsr2 family protein [Pseudonocardiaceae bacterium]